MIETDAIEECIRVASNGYVEDYEPKPDPDKARKQLAGIKELEPQWLPAGTMPDAEGWWLWAGNRRETTPIYVEMNEDGPEFIEGTYALYLAGKTVTGNRFAPMPRMPRRHRPGGSRMKLTRVQRKRTKGYRLPPRTVIGDEKMVPITEAVFRGLCELLGTVDENAPVDSHETEEEIRAVLPWLEATAKALGIEPNAE